MVSEIWPSTVVFVWKKVQAYVVVLLIVHPVICLLGGEADRTLVWFEWFPQPWWCRSTIRRRSSVHAALDESLDRCERQVLAGGICHDFVSWVGPPSYSEGGSVRFSGDDVG